jgi:hypothetical protein
MPVALLADDILIELELLQPGTSLRDTNDMFALFRTESTDLQVESRLL